MSDEVPTPPDRAASPPVPGPTMGPGSPPVVTTRSPSVGIRDPVLDPGEDVAPLPAPRLVDPRHEDPGGPPDPDGDEEPVQGEPGAVAMPGSMSQSMNDDTVT